MKRKIPLMTPKQEATARKALAEAVRLAGNPTQLAAKIGEMQGTVYYMLEKKGYALPQHVLKITAATGVPAHRLRPDIYPDPAA